MRKQSPTGSFSAIFSLLKDALTELQKNDPLRLAGATAFFTTFALSPILLILIQSIGFLFSTPKAQQRLFAHLSTYVGQEGVSQIVNTLNAFHKVAHNNYIIVLGFLFLLFVATTLFRVIKSSLNQLWKIKVVHRSKVGGTLSDRFKAFVVILAAGILFGIGLLAEGLQVSIGKRIFEHAPRLFFYVNAIVNQALFTVIVTTWCAVVFRYLPDARPRWAIVLTGACLTGVLFALGKEVLRWLLSHSNLNTLYGTSASVVLLMLFVFYASLILYYGAAFTKVWGVYKNQPIEPLRYASHYQLVTDEADEASNEA